MAEPLQIDFIADVVCPWCYLGWRRLHQALALRPDIEPHVVWRPYQLDPTLPEEGVDRAAYMAAKFPDPARLKTVHDHLVALGAEDGVAFDFARIERSPNTNAAHRLIRWAHGQGVQDAVVEGLLRAYFVEGRDIGAPEELAAIGAAAGMDRLLILKLLSEDADRETVTREHELAVRAGVSGVPFTIFAGRVAVAGAEPPDRLLQAIDSLAAAPPAGG
ncbi:disulfide bond formation protein DsbA [Caulobacter sp. CCUG 60055]|uniref:DsbA family oxidoreductase n=1 Tax=Caulobacter sp. CCUG 60055 TaxID=2100090 RepID=UPI001FA7349F|nr:DsbA family oxidoreductase [Caulobacter sp. CCUG 60055]MCI3178950.1 disulfide bond formation protein DsbA [Caulobacter sp. CCUG 60055]